MKITEGWGVYKVSGSNIMGNYIVTCLFLFLIFSTRVSGFDTVVPYGAVVASLLSVLIFPFALYYSDNAVVKRGHFIYLLLFFVFFMYVLLSSAYAIDQQAAIVRTLVYFPMLFVLMVSVLVDKDVLRTARLVTTLFLYYIVFLVILFFIVYFFGAPYFGKDIGFPALSLTLGPLNLVQISYGEFPFHRTGGAFGNPNGFGFLFFLGLYASLLRVEIDGRDFSYGDFFLVLICFLGVYISFSRSAILASFVFMCIYMAFRRPKVFYLTFIAFGLLAFFSYVFEFSFGGDVNNQRISLSLNSRDDIWVSVLAIFYESPIFGSGFASVERHLVETGALSTSSHSLHFLILSELGILGYAIFFVLAAVPICFLVRSFLVGRDRTLYMVQLAFMFSFFMSGFVEAFLFSVHLITFLWVYYISLAVAVSLR